MMTVIPPIDLMSTQNPPESWVSEDAGRWHNVISHDGSAFSWGGSMSTQLHSALSRQSPGVQSRDRAASLGEHAIERCFSVAMWDFSWLVRRSGRESEFRNLGQVLDEAVERGYTCLRIDPSPHLIAATVNDGQPDRFAVCPQARSFMWGNHEEVVVSPLATFRELLSEIRTRPITVGLSSWFIDDTTHCKRGIVTPVDFAEVWTPTLEVIGDEGMLDRVVWLDLCNEFPMSIWAPSAYRQIFRMPGPRQLTASAMVLGRPWGRRASDAISRYLEQSIAILRQRFPSLPFTFSFQEFGASNLRRVDLSPLDLIEAHIWLSDDLWWSTISGHYKAAFGMFRDGVRKHAQQATQRYPTRRERCLDVLKKRMQFWVDLAGDYQIPLVTTEGWASTFYDDAELPNGVDEWAWCKDFTEQAVGLALEMGWKGICTSNFCQPQFAKYWADREWHYKLNQQIAAGVSN